MPLSTRAKNANQHPSLILLADVKKRHTKEEVSTDAKKKRVNKETTRKVLENLCQFIADEEDKLAACKDTENEDILALSCCLLPEATADKELSPLPLACQDVFVFWNRLASDDGSKVSVNDQDRNSDKIIPDGKKELSKFGEDGAKGKNEGKSTSKTKPRQRRGARDAIQALQKNPDVNQVINNSLQKPVSKGCKRNVIGDEKIMTKKPCGLARVTKWTVALAKEHIVIDHAAKEAKKCTADTVKQAADKAKEDMDKGKMCSCALMFGPGSKDLSSITHPLSHATTPASVFSSTPTTNVGSSEGNPAVVQAFGGFQDKNNNLEELVSVLGKQGSHLVSVKIKEPDMPPTKR